MPELATGEWRLKVTGKAAQRVSLRARDAPLAKVAADLAKLLKTPVTVSPELRGKPLSIEIEALPLERALERLAPRVMVDYVAASESPDEARCLGIFFLAAAEPLPPLPATSTTTIMIEGEIEAGPGDAARPQPATAPAETAPDAPVLEVTCKDGLVTIHARQQPLPAILYEVGAKAGVPFALRAEPGDAIDLERANLTLDQLHVGLPAGVRVLFRRDLANGEVTPIRIEMVAPEPSARR